jgi:hypothetical protein
VSGEKRRFLTLIEIANEYGGSTWTWRLRTKDGRLASYKLAGEKSRIMVERDEVERFLAEGMRPRVTRTA